MFLEIQNCVFLIIKITTRNQSGKFCTQCGTVGVKWLNEQLITRLPSHACFGAVVIHWSSEQNACRIQLAPPFLSVS